MEMVTGHLKRAVLEELVIGYLRALCWRWLLATEAGSAGGVLVGR